MTQCREIPDSSQEIRRVPAQPLQGAVAEHARSTLGELQGVAHFGEGMRFEEAQLQRPPHAKRKLLQCGAQRGRTIIRLRRRWFATQRPLAGAASANPARLTPDEGAEPRVVSSLDPAAALEREERQGLQDLVRQFGGKAAAPAAESAVRQQRSKIGGSGLRAPG